MKIYLTLLFIGCLFLSNAQEQNLFLGEWKLDSISIEFPELAYPYPKVQMLGNNDLRDSLFEEYYKRENLHKKVIVVPDSLMEIKIYKDSARIIKIDNSTRYYNQSYNEKYDYKLVYDSSLTDSISSYVSRYLEMYSFQEKKRKKYKWSYTGYRVEKITNSQMILSRYGDGFFDAIRITEEKYYYFTKKEPFEFSESNFKGNWYANTNIHEFCESPPPDTLHLTRKEQRLSRGRDEYCDYYQYFVFEMGKTKDAFYYFDKTINRDAFCGPGSGVLCGEKTWKLDLENNLLILYDSGIWKYKIEKINDSEMLLIKVK